MRRAALLLTASAAAFAFRLFYGLSMPFWYEDERQVYLIGLQSFARGEWPYFGADVSIGGRVPGALLGWLVRAALEVIGLPEAPIVLINLLSLGALALFAWYLARRLPLVPRWLIGAALAVLPWTLNFSTHVMNPSYVLAGAIAFFVGFFEATTVFRRGLLPIGVAWLLMGAGLFWVMQMHLSWVLLPIFVVAAGVSLAFDRDTRAAAWPRALAGFIAGAALTGSLLAPTIVRYGMAAGAVDSAVQFQSQGLFGIVTTAARLLSFASFETNRFLGLSTGERAVVLWHQRWMIPFVIVVAAAGLAQPIWMIVAALRRRPGPGAGEWRHLRLLMLAAIVLVYGSYFFSAREQQAHSFYALLPLAAVFAATCWQARAEAHGGPMRGLERLAAAAIVSSVVVHAGLAIHRWPRLSLYANRSLVAAAIADRNDRYLGNRRGSPMETADGDRRADPVVDLEVVSSEWIPIVGRFSSFNVTIANRGASAAWLDIRYRTSYADAQGQVITVRDGVIKQILQPRETRTFDRLADDRVPPGAHSMTVTVLGAEPVVPVRTR